MTSQDFREKNTGQATQVLHSQTARDAYGSPHTPIYDTTTFQFGNTAELLDVISGRTPGYLYTRFGTNPTIAALEVTLAKLENAEKALAFSSGMAALSTLFLAHGREGIICLGDAYGGTLELLSNQLPLLGISTHFIDGPSELDAALAKGARLVFLETPANPHLAIYDIAAIASQARAHGAKVVVDNTFATPINQNPLALGADLVMHSATKYLGGHSDITAGAVMASAALIAPIYQWRKNFGSLIAPSVAAQLSRSLRTLAVRVQQHNANAMRVAEAMQQHPKVRKVYYPGLPNFPGHQVARTQMRGFGGMLTIELHGSRADTERVADRLKLFLLAPSLGGVESLVTQPCTTTHFGIAPEERARRGISDSMLRLSVGLEDAEDLIGDLLQALG